MADCPGLAICSRLIISSISSGVMLSMLAGPPGMGPFSSWLGTPWPGAYTTLLRLRVVGGMRIEVRRWKVRIQGWWIISITVGRSPGCFFNACGLSLTNSHGQVVDVGMRNTTKSMGHVLQVDMHTNHDICSTFEMLTWICVISQDAREFASTHRNNKGLG